MAKITARSVLSLLSDIGGAGAVAVTLGGASVLTVFALWFRGLTELQVGALYGSATACLCIAMLLGVSAYRRRRARTMYGVIDYESPEQELNRALLAYKVEKARADASLAALAAAQATPPIDKASAEPMADKGSIERLLEVYPFCLRAVTTVVTELQGLISGFSQSGDGAPWRWMLATLVADFIRDPCVVHIRET